MCTLATAACFSLAVRVNACSRSTHSLPATNRHRRLQELRGMDRPGWAFGGGV
jgi:hypothetical protein